MSEVVRGRYGRLLGELEAGQTFVHPWEVTVDQGAVALWQSSFLDATPAYASRTFARALGLPERPLHPLLCLNLALSFSVHDISEQAVAHLAYLDVRFPEVGHPGDTVSARSEVLGVRPASGGRGVVHVRTVLTNEHGQVLCSFERKLLVRAEGEAPPARTRTGGGPAVAAPSGPPVLPAGFRPEAVLPPARVGRFFEELAPEQIFLHPIGKTVGESEHMQLSLLVRNSHPLHFDELYARAHSFSGAARVVYGGLVFGWVAALASRDLAGAALWDLGYDQGAHPNGVIAGDTLYAASRVLEVRDEGPFGRVTLRLVGVKNRTAESAWAEHGEALFAEEIGKREGRITDKVFEITRTLAVRKRGSDGA